MRVRHEATRSENARFHPERRSPSMPMIGRSMIAVSFKTRRRRRRRPVSSRRLLAHRIFRENCDESRRLRETSRVRRRPTHTGAADLPVDTVQFNPAILRAHHTLFRSLFFARVSLFSLARVHRKHLAPPVRNARANLTLGGPNALLRREIFFRLFLPPRYARALTRIWESHNHRARF